MNGSPPCTSRYSTSSALLSLRRRLRPFGNPTQHVRYEVKPWTAGETTHSHHAVRDAAVSVARDQCATAPVLEKLGILTPRLPDDGEPPPAQKRLGIVISVASLTCWSPRPSGEVETWDISISSVLCPSLSSRADRGSGRFQVVGSRKSQFHNPAARCASVGLLSR